jgi:Tfp pilus assembly protein PilN
LEINLLPKRSPFEEYRFLLIALPILLVLAGGVFGLVRFWQIDSDLSLLQSDLYRVKSDNIVLRAERNADSKTKLFNDIQTSVHDVQQNEHHYGLMLDGIAAKLSNKTRVTSATMDADKQMVTLELQSDSVDNIADYATLLRTEPWVKDVFIQNIKNTLDDSADQQTQSFTPKIQEYGVQEIKPPTDPGKQQTQDFTAKVKKEIPFTTKVEITLAPNEISVKQPNETTKK